jgi:hypothetical protein
MGYDRNSEPYTPTAPKAKSTVPDPWALATQANDFANTSMANIPPSLMDDGDAIRRLAREGMQAPVNAFEDLRMQKNAETAAAGSPAFITPPGIAGDPGNSVFSGLQDYAGVWSAGPNAPKQTGPVDWGPPELKKKGRVVAT